MNFLCRFVKFRPKPISSVEENEYSKWSKDQLIERIIHLEQEKKRGSEEFTDVEQKRRKLTYKSQENPRKKNINKEFDFSKHNTRFVALKFAYLGWNYNGLAIQKERTPLPTIEGTILEAMYRCRLIPSMIPQEYNFSRCGRTDKGVSAMNQVISLQLRSNLTPDEQLDPENDINEIQYVNILNQVLPDDIKISAICLRPPKGFDARFSCRHRHYRYFFNKDGLDLEKMQESAKLYEGEHDFRNFCKLDGSKQITNYKRTILSSQILHIHGNIYCFDLIGSAFLWHQVRCMMANLFLIGQKLEEPSLIIRMMDINDTPQKPIYDMASDIPLILYNCEFPMMDWITPDQTSEKSVKSYKRASAVALDYEIKSTISQIFKDTLPESNSCKKITINIGDGKGRPVTFYKKLSERNVMDSVEVVNKKFKNRKCKNDRI